MKYLIAALIALAPAQADAGPFSRFLRSRSRPHAAAQPAKVEAKGPVYRYECKDGVCRRIQVTQ